jgi:hypothetical protein
MPTATAIRLMRERGIRTCQVEGCDNPAEEAHHVLFHNRKKAPKRLRDMLNDSKNLMLVCRECHRFTGKATSREARENYWAWACDYYGHEAMVKWYKGVPLKVKENFEGLDE